MTTRDEVARLVEQKRAAGVDGETERAKAQARVLEIIGILRELLVDEGLVKKLEFTSGGQIVSRGGLDSLSEQGFKMMNRMVGELIKLVKQGANIPPQYIISDGELDEISNRDLSQR